MSGAKLTAGSITTDQIRTLRADAIRSNDYHLLGMCDEALSAPLGSLRRATARDFCADVINDATEATL